MSPATVHISTACPGKQVDLNTGVARDGSPATDFGPCINALLAKASPAASVILVVDGSFAVSGIYGPLAGHWSLKGLGGGMDENNSLFGTGFYQIAGTNADVIHNGEKAQYTPMGAGGPATRGADVFLADFVINGNRGNGTNGNNTSGDPRRSTAGPWTTGVALHGLDHVSVNGLYIYNTASFNLVLDNVGDAEVDGDTFANTGFAGSVALGQNGDGLHIDGPANDIRSSHVTCYATDDCFALNAPEGSGGGTIQRVSISDWVMNSRTCGRMYTDSSSNNVGVRDITVSNVHCKSQSWAIMFGHADAGAQAVSVPGSITGIRITDSVFSSPFGFIVADSIGDLEITDTVWADGTCSHDHLAQPYCGFVQFATNSVPVEHLVLARDAIRFTAAGHAGIGGAVQTLQGWNGGSGNQVGRARIASLDITDFQVESEGGPYAPVSQLVTTDRNSVIVSFHQQSNDFDHITRVTNAPSALPTLPQAGAK